MLFCSMNAGKVGHYDNLRASKIQLAINVLYSLERIYLASFKVTNSLFTFIMEKEALEGSDVYHCA